MKLATITVISILGMMSAHSAPVESKKVPTIGNVDKRIGELRTSIEKTKTSLAKASQTPQEQLASFDTAIAAANGILAELAEDGALAKEVDKATAACEEKLKKLEEAARSNPKLEAALKRGSLTMRAELDTLYSKKTEMVKTQFDVMKKLKEFEQSKEAFALLSSINELEEANLHLADVIKGITALGSSLDDFVLEKGKTNDEAKPSKN
jgi:chromosome segregation ATPase